MKGVGRIWSGIIFLCLVSPLGLLASGDAWGEWGREFFQEVLGFVPHGLGRYSRVWNAPLPDYSVPGVGDVPGYIISAIAGIGLVAAITWLLGRTLSGGDKTSRG
jgi:hypothetical protein